MICQSLINLNLQPISWYMLCVCVNILLALACAWDHEQQSTEGIYIATYFLVHVCACVNILPALACAWDQAHQSTE